MNKYGMKRSFWKNLFFKKNNIKTLDYQPINIVTGGHLNITYDLCCSYLDYYEKLNKQKPLLIDEINKLRKLIVLLDARNSDTSNLKIQELANGKSEILEIFTDYNSQNKDSHHSIIKHMSSNHYKLNKLIHLDHIIAFSPIKTEDSNEPDNFLSTFEEYKFMTKIHIDYPLNLNNLFLENKEMLIENKTKVFHLINQLVFNNEKIYKPNFLFTNLFAKIQQVHYKTLTEKQVQFGLLNLRTIDKEYIDNFKVIYFQDNKSTFGLTESDLIKIQNQIKTFEDFYSHSINMMTFILSEEFDKSFPNISSKDSTNRSLQSCLYDVEKFISKQKKQ